MFSFFLENVRSQAETRVPRKKGQKEWLKPVSKILQKSYISLKFKKILPKFVKNANNGVPNWHKWKDLINGIQ